MSEADPLPSLPLVGKRFRCGSCGTEIIVLRSGPQPITCHGEPMRPIELRPLPSAD